MGSRRRHSPVRIRTARPVARTGGPLLCLERTDDGRAERPYDGVVADQRLLDALTPLVDALGAELVPCEDADVGDVCVEWEGEPAFAVRLPSLHHSLDRLLAVVEAEVGAPIGEMSREQQQWAVRRLDELGAFTLRRAVDDIARAIGISRFTVYNYLNALYR